MNEWKMQKERLKNLGRAKALGYPVCASVIEVRRDTAEFEAIVVQVKELGGSEIEASLGLVPEHPSYRTVAGLSAGDEITLLYRHDGVVTNNELSEDEACTYLEVGLLSMEAIYG